MKNCLYEYLKRIPEYFSTRELFNSVKNQKILTIIQNLSEVFNGKEFDISGLDLTTDKDIYRIQVKQLTDDLSKSNKRISELENTDIFKAAQLLATTNVKFEEYLSQIQNTQQQTIDKLQAKIEELTGKNMMLEKLLQQKDNENQQRDALIKQLSDKLIVAQSNEIQLKDKLLEQEQLRHEESVKITKLKERISDYERQSKRGKFFKSREGNS